MFNQTVRLSAKQVGLGHGGDTGCGGKGCRDEIKVHKEMKQLDGGRGGQRG